MNKPVLRNPSSRRFADGGSIQETPEQVMARIQAKYGVSGNSTTSAPAPVVASVQQPAPEKKAGSLLERAAGLFGNRGKQIDRAAGYSCGGKIRAMANGGKIEGPGSSTSDSIPGEVEETGEPIRVANGERILSAKQDALLQKIAKHLGFDTVDAMLEAGTGKPVGPTVKYGKKAAADGMAPEDQTGRPKSGLSPLNGAPGQQPITTGPLVSDPAGLLNKTGLPESLKSAATWLPEESPLRKAIGAPTNNVTPDKPTRLPAGIRSGADTPASNYAAPVGADQPIQSTQSAPALNNPATYRADLNATTWNDRSFDPTAQTIAPGTGAISINSGKNAGKNIVVGPQATAASDGGPLEGLQRIANANAIRQSMLDQQMAPGQLMQGGGMAVIGDGQDAENAARLAKWRLDDMQNQVLSAPRDKAAALSNLYHSAMSNAATVGGQALSAQAHDADRQVQMRGQDLTAKEHAAQNATHLEAERLRLAGNPTDQALKQIQLIQQQRLSGLQDQLSKETDPAKIKQLNDQIAALGGKDRGNKYVFHNIGGGVNEMGQPNPQKLVVANPETGSYQIIDQSPQTGTVPRFGSPAELQAAIKSGKVKSGDIVDTPSGQIKIH